METVIKTIMIVNLILIAIGLLMLWWCDYNLKKIAENLRRLDIEGEYRTKSHEIIFRWRVLRLHYGCDDSYVDNWYKELLKPFKQKREKFTHISDVWKHKTDYEMITAYIEDNKVLMDKIEKEMIKRRVLALGRWIMGLIGWILISIFCFYLVRNFYVSVVMIPLGNEILDTYNRAFEKRPFLKISPTYRNYYLLVLNPFRWHFLEIFKNDPDGRKLKVLWKECSEEVKNLRNLK